METNEAQHTPRPWHWHKDTLHIFAMNGLAHECVASVSASRNLHHTTNAEAREEAAANAQVIVTAFNAHEELLVACRDAAETIRGGEPSAGDHAMEGWAQDAVAALDAAIAKAEGNTPCKP